ncbi:MAG: M13 family metallopeptidase [Bacteroidia bacterium]|nr:M13 family metallopeptidase [Bacteroidia bacterium]
MNRSQISTWLFGVMFLCLVNACTNQKSDKMSDNNAIDPANFDKSVSPGSDFYHYANGGWLSKNAIPGEYSSYGAFQILEEENQKTLHEMMENAAKNKNAVKGSDIQKIGDFFATGMDTLAIEKAGSTPLKPAMDKISSLKSIKDLPALLAQLHYSGTFPIFYFYAAEDEKNSSMMIAVTYQGGLGLPERDYYLNQDAQSTTLRNKYQKHISNMFKLIGKSEVDATKIAGNIMKLETRLADASKSMADLRDPISNYNKMKIDAVRKLTPSFDWQVYLKELGVNQSSDINIGQPGFFTAVDKLLNEIPLDEWKDYITWNLISSNANNLSKAFVDENFDFFGKTLSGKKEQQKRWKKIVDATSESLGEIVGKAYVEKNFPPEAKTRMLELVNNLKLSLSQRIENLSWITPVTKTKALEKLQVMGLKIGYPDKWRDFSKLEINRNSYYSNMEASTRFEIAYMLAKIGKPADKSEWNMTPQTINAYYSPNKNEIVFPAAILQPPFFFTNADDAVNYGAIGTIIGHEMTHGFDDQGRLYDKSGNLNDWWTAEDAKKFKDATSVLVHQFDKFPILDSLHVNGQVTLGENIADLGGITVSYNALKIVDKDTVKIKGLTPDQRFFLSFAQVWRSNFRPEYLQMLLKVDVHSPAIARVNGVVYNVPEFYTAFKIKPDDKMYRKPEDRAKIW